MVESIEVATILELRPGPVLSLAEFLRKRQADILGDWQDAARSELTDVCSNGSRRVDVLSTWLEHLMAAAEGRPASAAGALARATQNGATLSDLSLLHRLIARRAHAEQVKWGLDESELLWSSFEVAVAELTARLHDEAQRAIRAREDILEIVTHDLRTPLSAVTAAASLVISMDSVEPDGARVRQRGETIRRAALHMSRLITDLTDLAQIDMGLAINKSTESPADVVKEVVEALEPVVKRRGGTLQAQVNADVPRIPLDRDRVRQVLANLVGNANKVGASEISVGAEPRGADVVFRVADNGPGIPPEDLPRMFDRYFRRRGTDYKGSGLGLPISNGIVKAHGGRMWIESTVGAGTTFYFSIPSA